MVVMEALKAVFNRGAPPLLSFYREKSGLEIDLLREYQRRPYAIEIKAGSTYAPEMTRPLRRFRSLREDLLGAALVYSGDETVVVDGVEIVPFAETARLLFPER